jgi:hypothetical protein
MELSETLVKSPAETIERLNQKFFGRRVETTFSSPLPKSRVFSKNFMRQLPDGTTQVSGWRETVNAPTLRQAQGERTEILLFQ